MGFKFNPLTGKFDLVNDSGSGSSTFIDLIDVDPTEYTNKEYSFVTVNETADGLEFSENLFLPKSMEATSEFPQVSSKKLILENAYWDSIGSEEVVNQIALRYVNDGLVNWISFLKNDFSQSEFLVLKQYEGSFGLYSRQTNITNPIELGNIGLITSNVNVLKYINGVGTPTRETIFTLTSWRYLECW